MNLDDDIDFFGLPMSGRSASSQPSTSTSSATSKTKKRKTPTNNNAARGSRDSKPTIATKNPATTAKKNNPGLLELKPYKNDSSSDSSSSSDEEGDDLALVQLAKKPTHKSKPKQSTSSKTNTATVTPGVKRVVSTSYPIKSNNNNKKPKTTAGSKQLGLHSFLTKKKAAKTKKTRPDSHATSSNAQKTAQLHQGGDNTTAATHTLCNNSNLSTYNNSQPNSFVSAATLMSGTGSNTNGQTKNDTIQEHIKLKNRQNNAQEDELEDSSDSDSSNNAIVVTAKQSDSEGTPKDEGMDINEEATQSEIAESNKKFTVPTIESKKERLLRMRKRHNPIEFSIPKTIYGQSHPRMDPKIKSRAINDLFSGTNYHKSRSHQSHRLLHGKSGINILSNLFQRSIVSTTPRISSNIQQHVNSGGKCWNVCDTVTLATVGQGVISGGEVCSMSFDKDGVLLATGDDRGCVRIYDFDDVYSMDAKKRNERARKLQERQDEVDSLEKKMAKNVNEDTKTAADAADGSSSDSQEGKAANNDEDISLSSSDANDDSNLPLVTPEVARPVVSFQCRARPGGNVGPRICNVLWSPQNQDYLAVSFA